MREKAGRRAESLAVWYLRAKGYRILERRFKTRRGEIDILARKGHILACVEVKHRQSQSLAEDSLSPHTRKRISDAARLYLANTPAVQGCALRYDAIFVIKRWRIIHHRDLWRDY